MVRSVEEDIQVVQTPSSYMFGDEFITWFTFVSTNFDDMNDKIIMRRKFWNLRNMAWHLCKSNPSPKLPITIDLLPEALLLQMLRITKMLEQLSASIYWPSWNTEYLNEIVLEDPGWLMIALEKLSVTPCQRKYCLQIWISSPIQCSQWVSLVSTEVQNTS